MCTLESYHLLGTHYLPKLDVLYGYYLKECENKAIDPLKDYQHKLTHEKGLG